MPGKSNYAKVEEFINEFCDIPEFIYDKEQMWEFVRQTNIKIKMPSSKSDKPRHSSAYTMFLKEHKKSMEDTNELSEKWQKMKDENTEEFKRFVNMAEEKDKENGLEPNNGTKTQTQSQEKKLQIELIQARAKGTEDEGKPIFIGKKIDSPINNYKEWKKAQLGKPYTFTLSRTDLPTYKIEDNFNKDTMEGFDWDNYIRENMLFLEDI